METDTESEFETLRDSLDEALIGAEEAADALAEIVSAPESTKLLEEISSHIVAAQRVFDKLTAPNLK
jgi:hypothetical protein